MNCFLYFVPGKGIGITDQEIADAGVSHAFEGRPGTSEVRAGPDGKSGLLLADPRVDTTRFNYHADSQVWQKIPGAVAWVGMQRDDRPGPEELARAQQLRGEWVELGDGRKWLVPLARGLSAEDEELAFYVALPTARTIGEDGAWRSNGILSRYQPLWDVASNYWDAVTGAVGDDGKLADGRLAFDFAGETDAAVLALATNYRIGAVEASMLELLDDLTVGRILNATVDFDRALEWIKKKVAADGELTGAG